MRKGSDILGKSVVAYDSGERVSTVKDLIFDQDSNQLLGLLVQEGGWFKDSEVIPFQGIQAIGSDAVIIPSESAVVRVSQLPEVKRILERNNILKGTHIMTTDGRDLGKMVDLYFDEQTGVIEGYEVSGGLFADAYSGRSYVPVPHTLKIGEHVAFVPSEVADLMEEQTGGIKAAVQTASEKVQSAAQTASDRIQVAAQETGYKLQNAGRAAQISVLNAVVNPAEQKEFAIGKISQKDVSAADGTLIVLAGQPISSLDAQQAEEKHVLGRLYEAAGGDARQQLSDRFQAGAQEAETRLQIVADQANEKFQDLQRSATSSLTNAVVSPAEQKAFVLDRVAEWSVATPDNIVIVTGGQVVTAAMVHKAEQLGVLDELYRATGGRIRGQIAVMAESAVAGYGVEQAKGRRVQAMVRARNGLIVAAPGQIVTATVIERAKSHQVERELLNSVGLSSSTAIRAQANGTVAGAGDRLSSTTQTVGAHLSEGTLQVRQGARTLWEQTKQTAHALQHRSAQTIEEQRIKSALGRPVTRVILDQQDDVILNVGELITHQAIASARQANVLDVLLGSVYTQTPQFSKAEMSAPEAGKAALTASHV
ncbi:MAG: hypothetical protein HC772_05845 [Leptolyngbyaceae cyanobacterium CRU_2_3]|nr:hypothetical protein [Leptolyngbyaceae cyanobacterium CRU_2_3]